MKIFEKFTKWQFRGKLSLHPEKMRSFCGTTHLYSFGAQHIQKLTNLETKKLFRRSETGSCYSYSDQKTIPMAENSVADRKMPLLNGNFCC